MLLLLSSCARAEWAPPPGEPLAAPAAETDVVLIADPPPAPEFADRQRRNKLLAATPEIEAALARAYDKQASAALAVGLVIDGELALVRGYGRRTPQGGKVDADTVFRIGSITKTFTATAALMLRDDGKLDLDAPAARYLPELATLRYPNADAAPISLRRLLTHTSGLPRLGDFDYTDPHRRPDTLSILDTMAGFPLRRAPGMPSHYSNLGASLAGLVIARVAQKRYRDYVTTALLRPLGMHATQWDAGSVPRDKLATAYGADKKYIPPRQHWRLGASEAAGGLYSNVADLARYAAFYLSAWPPRNDRDEGPLSRSSRREAQSMMTFDGMSLRIDKAKDTARATGVGLGWIVEQSCRFEQLVWHNGGTEGYSSALLMLPQRGVAVIALASGPDDLVGIAKELLTILDDTGALTLREPRPTKALARAFSHIDGLLVEKVDYDALFNDGFRQRVTRGALIEDVRALVAEHGRCSYARLTSIGMPQFASAEYQCERGKLEVRVSLDEEDPSRINSLRMDAQEEPRQRCH